MRFLWHRPSGQRQILRPVRRFDSGTDRCGAVQAGDRAVRRCGGLDGACRRPRAGALPRAHDRLVGPLGGGGTPLRRNGGVDRRRRDGHLRRPDCVGGPRPAGMSGRSGHPGGCRTIGHRRRGPRPGKPQGAGRPEFGTRDRGRDRLGVAGIRRNRPTCRDGAAHGISGAPGFGDAVGVNRVAGRNECHAGRPRMGPHQGRGRTSAGLPTAGGQPSTRAHRASPNEAHRQTPGDGHSRQHRQSCNGRPRRCRQRGGTPGYRQIPGGPRGRDTGHCSWRAGDLVILRVPRP